MKERWTQKEKEKEKEKAVEEIGHRKKHESKAICDVLSLFRGGALSIYLPATRVETRILIIIYGNYAERHVAFSGLREGQEEV